MNIRKGFPLLALGTLMHVSADAYAQAGTAPAAPDSSTTVVTLYSEVRPAPGTPASNATAQRPIQIVNGGVKSAGDSCWKLSDKGEVITQPGDCYVLRSAQPGETPPAR